jgi:excisionase family DNA binding protein
MDFQTRDAFAVREFCARYGICRDTFYREVKLGRLRAVKVGHKTLVLKSDAENWAASLPEARTSLPERRAGGAEQAHAVRDERHQPEFCDR